MNALYSRIGLRAVAAVLSVAALGCTDARVELGRRLYAGEEALSARLGTQGAPLPKEATRCINCHGDNAAPVPWLAASAASSPAQARLPPPLAAPPLTRAQLTQALPRLNGPPVAYDRAAFCRTVLLGITPNHITVSATMPRYALTPSQCEALWAYVSQR